MRDADLAIVGSGFGGSLLAMIARRLGLRVALIERGRHPRFAIGESASPLAGILLEQLADRYDLPRVRPLSAYGTWRRSYPGLDRGLKRGFSFFRHEQGRSFTAAPNRSDQLLVAASPSDELSDTHWLRSELDAFLVEEAVALGAEYQDLVTLERAELARGGDVTLKGVRQGRPMSVRARYIVDASGPRGFLFHALGLSDRGFPGYPATQALYSHFEGVARVDQMPDYAPPGDEVPPYPVDDAAVHHVFDGGWMWVLRFDGGTVSAGVALEDWLAAEVKLAERAPAWRRLLARYPSIAAQFADARPVREFTHLARLPFRADVLAGERWALLPSAAAFTDPMFSSGIPLTLLGVERLARILESWVPDKERLPATESYVAVTAAEADLTATFLAGCYASFPDFPVFAAYSMLYFATASYGEMARRLAPGRPAIGFLGAAEAGLSAAVRELAPGRGEDLGTEALARRVRAAIEPWNVAGLSDGTKRNWYGVDFEDTIRAASSFGLTPDQVRGRLVAQSVVY